MTSATTPRVLEDAQAIRHAGQDVLSLALIDSRNHLLQLLAQDESPASLLCAAHAGWFQEHWISCHVQRQRGEGCDALAPRLAGIEPAVDRWLHAGGTALAPQQLRQYLQDTLEITLDLLAACPNHAVGSAAAEAAAADASLYFYRLALLHEDRQCELLALALGQGKPPARSQHSQLWLPAQRWQLGSPRGGLVPWAERWAHPVAVPDFEIDAQPVNWSQYVEFVEDGGYDQKALWSAAGWAWLLQQAEAGQPRRAPRDVEQVRGGVLVQRRNAGTLALQRVASGQPVTQVSHHEAQAWCTWAGRRLPTEAEWELAACTAASRGFVWGEVLEWVAGSARPWPGAGPVPPGILDAVLGVPLQLQEMPQPWPPGMGAQDKTADPSSWSNSGVLRGATCAARARWRHPKARRFALASTDTGPIGFRTCTL